MVLPLWVEFFEDLQHVRGRSLNTVQAYRRDLELYGEFRDRFQDVSRIYDFMKQKGLSVRSQGTCWYVQQSISRVSCAPMPSPLTPSIIFGMDVSSERHRNDVEGRELFLQTPILL